jgi:hypothetical protein
MLTAGDLILALAALPRDTEIRIGDVSEGDDLHVSVDRVVLRSQCAVLVPGEDDIWRDEQLASEILMRQLWPKEEDDGS